MSKRETERINYLGRNGETYQREAQVSKGEMNAWLGACEKSNKTVSPEVRSRVATAGVYYRDELGMSTEKTASYLRGIDTSQPVHLEKFQKGQKLYQYQRPKDGLGNHSARDKSQTADRLGVSAGRSKEAKPADQKELREVTVKKDGYGLVSKARPYKDAHSSGRSRQSTNLQSLQDKKAAKAASLGRDAKNTKLSELPKQDRREVMQASRGQYTRGGGEQIAFDKRKLSDAKQQNGLSKNALKDSAPKQADAKPVSAKQASSKPASPQQVSSKPVSSKPVSSKRSGLGASAGSSASDLKRTMRSKQAAQASRTAQRAKAPVQTSPKTKSK